MVKQEQKSVLKKYFSGECSDEERKLLEQTLLNEDNPSLSEYLKAEWESTPEHLDSDDLAAKARFSRISKGIQKRRKFTTAWLSAAAAILVLSIPLYFIFQNHFGQTELKWVTVTTGLAERKELKLQDGSEISLKAGSTISYPQNFATGERRIKIEGEAFFKVAKNKHWPFIVEFDQYYTKVLGTAFNVKALPNQKTYQVTVEEGRVAVGRLEEDKLQQQAILNASERVTFFVNSSRFEKEVIPALDHAIAGTRRGIQFRDTPLDEVIQALNENYRSNLVLSKDKRQIKMPAFTLIVRPGTSLEDVLKILSMTQKISYQKKNNQTIIYLK